MDYVPDFSVDTVSAYHHVSRAETGQDNSRVGFWSHRSRSFHSRLVWSGECSLFAAGPRVESQQPAGTPNSI